VGIVAFTEHLNVAFRPGDFVDQTMVLDPPTGKRRLLRHISGEFTMPKGQVVFALTFGGHVYRVTHSGDAGDKSYFLIDSETYEVLAGSILVYTSRSSNYGGAYGTINFSGELIDW
jgi:hypothetical protein